jgi:uncharacterized membrane protein
MDLFPLFRGVHILLGSLALVIAPLAMLTIKGGRWHRRWGKIYFYAMAGVAFTAKRSQRSPSSISSFFCICCAGSGRR